MYFDGCKDLAKSANVKDGHCVPWDTPSGAAREIYGKSANGWVLFAIADERSCWYGRPLSDVRESSGGFKNTLPEKVTTIRKPAKAKVVSEEGNEEASAEPVREKTPTPRRRGRPPKKKMELQTAEEVSVEPTKEIASSPRKRGRPPKMKKAFVEEEKEEMVFEEESSMSERETLSRKTKKGHITTQSAINTSKT